MPPVEEALVRERRLLKKLVPETVRLVADAFPRVDVPATTVENVPVVNVGLEVMEMVEVPEKRTFAPAVR